MTAFALRSIANCSFSGLDATATVWAPKLRATSSIASPTPPAAPKITTQSSGRSTVRRVRVNQAVQYD